MVGTLSAGWNEIKKKERRKKVNQLLYGCVTEVVIQIMDWHKNCWLTFVGNQWSVFVLPNKIQCWGWASLVQPCFDGPTMGLTTGPDKWSQIGEQITTFKHRVGLFLSDASLLIDVNFSRLHVRRWERNSSWGKIGFAKPPARLRNNRERKDERTNEKRRRKKAGKSARGTIIIKAVKREWRAAG